MTGVGTWQPPGHSVTVKVVAEETLKKLSVITSSICRCDTYVYVDGAPDPHSTVRVVADGQTVVKAVTTAVTYTSLAVALLDGYQVGVGAAVDLVRVHGLGKGQLQFRIRRNRSQRTSQ